MSIDGAVEALTRGYLWPGTITQVLGDSGSGLSRLARRVAEARAGAVVVPQEAQSALSGLRDTVSEEVAFGLEQRGVSRERMVEAVRDAVGLLGLGEFAWSHPHALSGGQTRRLVLAAMAVLESDLMVADDPLAGLDTESRGAVVTLYRDLARRGRAILVVGYDPVPELAGSVLWWNGADLGEKAPRRELALPDPVTPGREREYFRCVRLRRGENFRSGPHTLSVARGGVTWVRGPNGAGKTSLLRALAGLDGATPTTAVALALQSSRDQVIDARVAGMVGQARSCRRWGIEPEAHPLDLAASDLRCAQVLGAVQLGRPVVALDEPDVGCDAPGRHRVHCILAEYLASGGGIVLTCHDEAFVAQVSRYARVEIYDLDRASG
ncbi:ATP-binding cassette domain-containing protein [Corynebacterium sp. zg-331]|uniref:ATP-binding cassette domain-containing protein n=1 Tax=unclassified Corynebacterium TaxID=2624378 RepID=UPI00128BAEA5|nr:MULTISPECIES: ATP-binding cassette domain-containing protein [unclassified Corynebacterium]MBC3186170.1 ATP-binding cassette domain-containing protein [Corynebacterium sp. zg-331]MPV52659.1 ATP-binding cassette domain-containing protein [Corynebacterium sp. zg331]